MTAIQFSHKFLGRRRGGGESYWVSRIQTSALELGGLCVDSTGKVYLNGYWFSGVANSKRQFMARLNSDGTIDNTLGIFPTVNRAWGAPAIKSDGTSAVYFPYNSYDDTGSDSWFARLCIIGASDSDYTTKTRLNSAVKTGVSDDDSVSKSAVASVDSSGNPYFAGLNVGAATVFKLNTSLGVTWSKQFSYPYASQFSAIDVRGSDLALGSSNYKADDPNWHGVVIKIATSNGDVTWQKQLLPPAGSELSVFAVAIDSTGRVIVVGRGFVSANLWRGFVAAVSADGSSISWIRQFYVANRNIIGVCVSVDSNDNIYAQFEDANGGDCYLARYNSSGTLQWQRRFTYASSVARGKGLYVRGDVMWVSLLRSAYTSTSGGGNIFVWKLPTNGGKVGANVRLNDSFGVMSYSAASATDAAWSGCSLAASSPTVSAPSAAFESITFTTVSGTPNTWVGVM